MQLTLTNLVVLAVVGAAVVWIIAQLLAGAKAKSTKDDRFGEYPRDVSDMPFVTKGYSYDPNKRSFRCLVDHIKYWFSSHWGD